MRLGMWVKHGAQLAIIRDLTTPSHPVIVYVDAQGLFVSALQVPAQTVRQAKFQEIPESRRPSQALATLLGY